jgi:hypothetical protein
MVYLLSILIPFDSIRGHMTTCISCAEAEAVLLVFHDSDATLPVSFLFAFFFSGLYTGVVYLQPVKKLMNPHVKSSKVQTPKMLPVKYAHIYKHELFVYKNH